MREALRQYIRSNGRSAPLRKLAQTAHKYLRMYYNEDFYDGAKNGENRVVELLIADSDAEGFVAVDVGAHRGFWSAFVLEHMQSAEVFCFEIVSPIREDLYKRFADNPSVHVLDYGLSSSTAVVDVTHNLAQDSTNSITPDTQSKYFDGSELVVLQERVVTGDTFVDDHELDHIDVLKIDVEGHEVDVLHGFAKTLRAGTAPRLIQFEYGYTFLWSRQTLRQVYDILEPQGYVIGRVYPDRVDFKPYESVDDHFRMGNYVAVKADDTLHTILQ